MSAQRIKELEGFLRGRLAVASDVSTEKKVHLLTRFCDYLDSASLDDEMLKMFDKLARKIEITGRVYASYHEEHFSAVEDSGELSIRDLETTLAVYLLLHFRTGDPRFLNTVLKALDGVLKLPSGVSFEPFLTEWADEAIGRLGQV